MVSVRSHANPEKEFSAQKVSLTLHVLRRTWPVIVVLITIAGFAALLFHGVDAEIGDISYQLRYPYEVFRDDRMNLVAAVRPVRDLPEFFAILGGYFARRFLDFSCADMSDFERAMWLPPNQAGESAGESDVFHMSSVVTLNGEVELLGTEERAEFLDSAFPQHLHINISYTNQFHINACTICLQGVHQLFSKQYVSALHKTARYYVLGTCCFRTGLSNDAFLRFFRGCRRRGGCSGTARRRQGRRTTQKGGARIRRWRRTREI